MAARTELSRDDVDGGRDPVEFFHATAPELKSAVFVHRLLSSTAAAARRQNVAVVIESD
jgi:hypothetical protein